MNEYMIQARDNKGNWEPPIWRSTLEEAKACADECADRSLNGQAIVVHWREKGKYCSYVVTVEGEITIWRSVD